MAALEALGARIEERPELVSHRGVPALLLFVGLVLSLVLFAVLRQQDKTRAQADDAERRAAELIEAAQNAVRVRDEFLSIASHELDAARDPGLAGAEPAHAREGGHPDGRALQKKVGSMDRQLGRLNRLINELLDVTRISAGRLSFDLEPVDLAAVVREVVDALRRRGLARGLPAARDGDGPGARPVGPHAPRAGGDQSALERGEVRRASAHRDRGVSAGGGLAADGQGGLAILRVTDHGMGIQQENLTRIFERFERAVSERNFGGLGLGLWIVRQIVEGLGGTIHVESDMGVGSAFTVTPARGSQASCLGTPEPQAPEPEVRRARSEA